MNLFRRMGLLAMLLAATVQPVLAAYLPEIAGTDRSSAVTASPNGMARSLSARASDVFNPMDYGALGDGSGRAIGTTYGATLAALAGYTNATGGHPFGFANDPRFGLTFSMTPSASTASGAAPIFLYQHGAPDPGTGLATTIGDKATVAIWQNPAHGNYMVTIGMQVTGACLAGTSTVTGVGRSPGLTTLDPTYGTVTLNPAPTSACGLSTPLLFTTSPAQVQVFTMDWLGWQAAMAQAFYSPFGGRVQGTRGLYVMNRTLVNPGGIIDNNNPFPNIEIAGAGNSETTLSWPNDLGLDMGGITEANSAGDGVSSNSAYHDLRLVGPGNGGTYGVGNTTNNVLTGMDGFRIGRGAVLRSLLVNNFNADISGVNDHWNVYDVAAGNATCGVRERPYTYTMGNQSFEGGSVASNYLSGFCVSTTNQFDSGLIKNVHNGFGPHGWWLEADTANVTQQMGFLSYSTIIAGWVEDMGNCYICGALDSGGNPTGGVTNNTFIGAGGNDIGHADKAILDSSGAVTPTLGVVAVQNFDGNTMINTTWGAYSKVSKAIVVATYDATGNTWNGDVSILQNPSNPAIGIISVADTHLGNNNVFKSPIGDGLVRRIYNPQPVPALSPLMDGLSFAPGFTQAYHDGGTFAGIAAFAVTAQNPYVPVFTSANFLDGVVKADPNQAIVPGQPLFPTSTPNVGFAGGLNQRGSVGSAVNSSGAGTGSTVQINLEAIQAGGAPGAAAGLTASGAVLTSQMSQFSTVASGGSAILGIIPVGDSETVCNDGANALTLTAPSGSSIQGSAAVAAGACGSFRRLTGTLWHS